MSNQELTSLLETIRVEMDVDYEIDTNRKENLNLIRQFIDNHFEKIVWSLLKQEWRAMSEGQKAEFCLAVYKNI